jgi:hypothetical protein
VVITRIVPATDPGGEDAVAAVSAAPPDSTAESRVNGTGTGTTAARDSVGKYSRNMDNKMNASVAGLYFQIPGSDFIIDAVLFNPGKGA